MKTLFSMSFSLGILAAVVALTTPAPASEQIFGGQKAARLFSALENSGAEKNTVLPSYSVITVKHLVCRSTPTVQCHFEQTILGHEAEPSPRVYSVNHETAQGLMMALKKALQPSDSSEDLTSVELSTVSCSEGGVHPLPWTKSITCSVWH